MEMEKEDRELIKLLNDSKKAIKTALKINKTCISGSL